MNVPKQEMKMVYFVQNRFEADFISLFGNYASGYFVLECGGGGFYNLFGGNLQYLQYFAVLQRELSSVVWVCRKLSSCVF